MKGKSSTFFKAAGIVIVITLLSRILGLIRETSVAWFFGASRETDAFFVAFKIPDLLFNSLINFFIGTAFIPIFSGYVSAGDNQSAARFFSAAATWTTGILILFVVFVEFFAPRLVNLIAPGLDVDSRHLASTLTRIMVPIVVFAGLTGIAKSALNSLYSFVVPSFIPVTYNIVFLAALFGFGAAFGVYAMAVGVLSAAIMQVAIQLPLLSKHEIRFEFKTRTIDNGLAQYAWLAFPVGLGLVAGHAVPVLELYFASRISAGAISHLNYANRIFLIPDQIFSASLATVLLPFLAAHIARNDWAGMNARLSSSIRSTIFVLLPLSILMALFSEPIVRALLGRGAFDDTAIGATALILSAYSIGLTAVGLRYVLTFTFFSMKKPWIILALSSAMVPVNLVLNFLLVPYFSTMGLAFGFSVTAILNAGLLLMLLRRSIDGVTILRCFWKCAVSGAAMYAVLAVLDVPAVKFPASLGQLREVFAIGLSASLGLVSYVFACHILGLEEPRMAVRMAARFFSAAYLSIRTFSGFRRLQNLLSAGPR